MEGILIKILRRKLKLFQGSDGVKTYFDEEGLITNLRPKSKSKMKEIYQLESVLI